jgi:DNA-binding transcriptional regulator YiaG
MSADAFYLSNEKVRAEPYRYRACGLDGIYLLNGYTIEEHDGEQHVTVRNVDGLHQAIGRHLVANRKALSPKEIRFLRNTLDLTQAELAERLGNTSQSVARWEKGECEMPGAAEKLLRALFLVSVMTEEEFQTLRKLLESTELDQMDDQSNRPVQFELFGNWIEKKAA